MEQRDFLDECPICKEALGDGQLCSTNCGHVFHRDCMDEWIKNRKEKTN